jgi:hypothetical protein
VGLVGACSLLSYIIPSSYHRIHPLGCLQTAEMSAKITVAYHLKKMLVRPGQRQYWPLGGLRMAANAGPDPSSGVACRYTCSMIRPSCTPYAAFPFFPRNKFKDKATCLESRRHTLEPQIGVLRYVVQLELMPSIRTGRLASSGLSPGCTGGRAPGRLSNICRFEFSSHFRSTTELRCTNACNAKFAASRPTL